MQLNATQCKARKNKGSQQKHVSIDKNQGAHTENDMKANGNHRKRETADKNSRNKEQFKLLNEQPAGNLGKQMKTHEHQ